MNLLNHYDKFQAQNPTIHGDKALEYIRTQGLPTRQNEDWKYTSLKFLTEKDYTPVTLLKIKSSHEDLAAVQKVFSPDFINIVFFNGVFDKTISQNLPAGIDLIEINVEKTHFIDGVEALNALYTPRAYSLVVKKESSHTKPINLIFWSQGELALVCSFLKISVETRAQAQFLMSHQGDHSAYVSNSVTEMNIAESAKVSIVKIQEENISARHIGLTRIHVSKSAELESMVFSTGAKLSRHTLEVLMTGEGGTAHVHGAYAVVGDQHVDNNTTIDHVVGHCNTYQLYKGLLDGESRAVFNGKVLIRRNAQKANSEQLNNNLLLSRKAEADSKPMLQIDADDVKAAHGSTVGQMNKEELFYLLSRAIPKSKAITMLSYGFLSEVLERIANDEVKEWLKIKLDKAFTRIATEHL